MATLTLMITDFGDRGPNGKFRKLDLFDAYCVKHRLDKRDELKRDGGIVDQYLQAQGQPARSVWPRNKKREKSAETRHIGYMRVSGPGAAAKAVEGIEF